MKRATTVGLATGVILSLLFIGAGLLRNSLTVTTLTQQWFFLGVFVILVVSTLWVANNYVCKSGTAQLGAMSICGISSTLGASFIFSVVSFIYTQYIDSSYLPNLMAQSQSLWDEKQYSQASIAGQLEWQWFKSPYSFAISNFQTAIVLLGLISIATSSVYYFKHKNRPEEPVHHRNHELIY